MALNVYVAHHASVCETFTEALNELEEALKPIGDIALYDKLQIILKKLRDVEGEVDNLEDTRKILMGEAS